MDDASQAETEDETNTIKPYSKQYLTSNLFLPKKWLLWTSFSVFRRDGISFSMKSPITKKAMAVKKLKALVRSNEITS